MKEGKEVAKEILTKIDNKLDVLLAKRQSASSVSSYTEVMAFDRAWEAVDQLKQDVTRLLQETTAKKGEEDV